MSRSRTCRGCPASLAGMRADAVWCSPACAMRARRDGRANKARTRSGPSGLQVSYRKAVEVVACDIADVFGVTKVSARLFAENAIRDALSSRQRELLQARDA